MLNELDFAVIVPMANEEKDFHPFIDSLAEVLDSLRSGIIFLIVDDVSKDNTLAICKSHSEKDKRFITIYAPENKNVVDAYLRGYREAYKTGHQIIIEMDAGGSHDPKALPMFLRALNEGYECVFGSRFISGGSMADSPFWRRFLSKAGTYLSNFLLGTGFKDMTSGYQGFYAHVVKRILDTPIRSKAHFYQTELRYLLREKRFIEVPIHYKAPSPNVSRRAIINSFSVLAYYFFKRITGKPKSI